MPQNQNGLPSPDNGRGWTSMDIGAKLSTLWIFASLNYLYCDLVSLMDPELLPQYLRGSVNGLDFSPGVLLGSGVLVEIFIAMVLLSRVLRYRANRWTNVAAGTFMTAVQVATLSLGTPALYYVFFSAIEIATTVVIVRYAWAWSEPDGGAPSPTGGSEAVELETPRDSDYAGLVRLSGTKSTAERLR